ncbi:MAG: PspC domain-containing protein [Xanthomonadales bacterium]|nr:PspC domain-containing protein [Xanthomonadales bacterium]
MRTARAKHPGELLAGVCAGIAARLGWNVWALRILFVALLLIKTLWAIGAYLALAVIFRVLDAGLGGRQTPPGGLGSPELAKRNHRISELERKFRELENGDRQSG